MWKAAFVGVATVGMMVAMALPAVASEVESGSRSCGGLSKVATRGNASGVQTHVHNSTTKKFADSGNTVVDRYFATSAGGEPWGPAG